MEQFLAYVAVEDVSYHFDILYGYAVPDNLKSTVAPGIRVQVPFGRGKSQRQGVVFSVGTEEYDSRYKSVIRVLDSEPILNGEMLELARFLKERTFCTYYEAAKIQMPVGLNLKMKVTYAALALDEPSTLTEEQKTVYDYMLSEVSYMKKEDILKACSLSVDSDAVDKLVSKNLAVKNYDAYGGVSDQNIKTASIAVEEDRLDDVMQTLTPKQKSVVNVLHDVGSASVKELCYFTGTSAAVITALEKKQVIAFSSQRVYRMPKSTLSTASAEKEIVLSPEQQSAYENLLKKYNGGGGVSLLFGVTGSGKTSVFVKLIDSVLESGRQVIVMVPEIALTAQMMATFKGRYGEKVAIFHSGLSVGERKDEYMRVKEGKASVALGTRSAVFAPFDNVGLIVMDEEQEHTYKSEASPRYHARDVAKQRAAYHKALLLLSSATPSVESYSYALSGRYGLERLTKRYANAVLPEVTIVDLKADRKMGNKYSISLQLQELIRQNLKDKKQTILLINRRGYNTFAACDECGNVITCPSCSISLTFHKANNRLMCHYCGYSAPFTLTCPSCGKNSVRYAGYGTQRIEQELAELFPEARILRMDADSSSSRYSFEKNISDFGGGEYDIMIGTQMVAKGLNFEKVTVVGVINADISLHNDDFRSQENTFDLLTQVVGRSGRGRDKGVAVIQTLNPENDVISLSGAQDYETFYKSEIAIRKAMTYPPFCELCVVTVISENELEAQAGAKSFVERITDLSENEYKNLKMIVLEPMPPRISKVNNRYRYRIIIKCKNSRDFRRMMSQLMIEFGKCRSLKDVTFVCDINPASLC